MDTRRGTEAGVKTRISNLSKGSISHFEKRVEVQDNRQDHTENDPHFCKSVLAENIGNTVDEQSQQQGPLG